MYMYVSSTPPQPLQNISRKKRYSYYCRLGLDRELALPQTYYALEERKGFAEAFQVVSITMLIAIATYNSQHSISQCLYALA